MKTFDEAETESLESLFGPVISGYSRAQAIADGVLVDVSTVLTPCPFKYPVAMTLSAWSATCGAGGEWVPAAEGSGCTQIKLPGGQDVAGRLHDVFTMMLHAIESGNPADRLNFRVLIDARGIGRPQPVDLYAVCGPGYTAAPVLTILLPNED